MPDDYRRMRREAIVAAIIWVVAGVWTLTACYTLSAQQPPRFVAGLPAWVVWGILAPWLTTFAVHVWYSLFFVGGRRED